MPTGNGAEVAVVRYNSVQYGDQLISVGDAVYLTPEEQGGACEICEITDLYEVEDDDNHKRATVQWFWRPGALDLVDEQSISMRRGRLNRSPEAKIVLERALVLTAPQRDTRVLHRKHGRMPPPDCLLARDLDHGAAR